MRKKTFITLGAGLVFLACICPSFSKAAVADSHAPSEKIITEVVTVRAEQQYESVGPGGKSAVAIHFELESDWHFYASAETAPGGMNLKIIPVAVTGISFSAPVFPEGKLYFDKSSGLKLNVFSKKFTVYLPFTAAPAVVDGAADIRIAIEGAVCSDIQCRMPDFGQLSTKVKITGDATMDEPRFVVPAVSASRASSATAESASYSWMFALGLAFLAGLSLNIMPCVWPVLPIIVMRLVDQAKQSRAKSIAMGLAFCTGILLFFACLAGANIILQLFYGTVLQWGDQFRNPAFVMAMAILLVVLALFMFDLFTFSVPSSVSGKAGSGKGYTGSVGMGFLAAILSTPCSFAILAAAFAWAQAQPLMLATIAIMVIGVGMAAPYVILTSLPALLKRIPKPGQWMELFKQGIGFVLLLIAVKLISALPQVQRISVLYFCVVLAFSIWMWGGWVSHSTESARKWIIRIIALALIFAAGKVFLTQPVAELIKWQKYDAALIEKAIEQQKPVLIKFTADWCMSCQVVEKIVYSRHDVAQLIEDKGVLAIKADTTAKDYPATLALKNIYKEPGVPVTILFLPGQAEPVRWRDMSFAEQLNAHLETLP